MDKALAAIFFLIAFVLPANAQLLGVATSNPGGCIPAAGHTYTTSFPLTETPISECNSWTNGGAFGFHNVNTTSGLAYGTQNGTLNDFKDSTALLVGTWGNDQQISFIIKNGNPGSSQQEIEARLRSSLSSNNSTGYEADFIISPAASCGGQNVRWNGPIGNFTVLGNQSMTCAVTGDTFTTTMIGSTMKIYSNGLLLVTSTDSTYTSGQPGMGTYFFGTGATGTDFGQTSMRFTDKPLHSVAHTSKDNTATNVALTAQNTTGATEIVVVVFWNSTVRTVTCTGSTSGALSAITGPTTILSTYSMEIFHKDNPATGASDAITCTLSGSGSIDIGAAETAVVGVAAVDQAPAIHAATGATASATTTGTTTALDEYLVGTCVVGGIIGSGPTAQFNSLEGTNFGGNAFYDGISVKLQTIAFSVGQGASNPYGCWVGTFK